MNQGWIYQKGLYNITVYAWLGFISLYFYVNIVKWIKMVRIFSSSIARHILLFCVFEIGVENILAQEDYYDSLDGMHVWN